LAWCASSSTSSAASRSDRQDESWSFPTPSCSPGPSSRSRRGRRHSEGRPAPRRGRAPGPTCSGSRKDRRRSSIGDAGRSSRVSSRVSRPICAMIPAICFDASTIGTLALQVRGQIAAEELEAADDHGERIVDLRGPPRRRAWRRRARSRRGARLYLGAGPREPPLTRGGDNEALCLRRRESLIAPLCSFCFTAK
jgi:hypothetical protein